MSAKFAFATGDVLKFVATIKKQYHPGLRDSRIHVLWREDADFGHITLAQVVPPVSRFMEQVDAYLFVHKGAWKDNLNESQKAYWIDHALCMLYASDKIMDDGRPKLGIEQQEKIGYSAAIQRHGMVTDNLKRVRTAVMESAQVNIFDLLHEVNMEQFAYNGYNADDAAVTAGQEALEMILAEPDNELFIRAARLVMDKQWASVALLQRQLKIGYYAAAILMDKMQDAGFVGPFNGSAPREIFVTDDMLAFYEESHEAAQEVAVTAEQENGEVTAEEEYPPLDIFAVDDQEPPQPGMEA